MKGMFEYKGYFGSVKYSEEDHILYGKIEFIRDLIDYQGEDVETLKKAFEESVDDYFETCKQLNKEPDRAFKGSFNIRIGEDLHRESYHFAMDHHISLNELVSKALEKYIDPKRDIYVWVENSGEFSKPIKVMKGQSRITEVLEEDYSKDNPISYKIQGE